MKKILTLTSVLSWINLLVGAMLVIFALIVFLSSPAAGLAGLFIIVLSGSLILHSYAAMQLRRSILYPSIPLSAQTPSGIRIMGFIALFFAMMSFANAIVFIQQAPELAKQVSLPPQVKNLNVVPLLRASGIVTLIISLSIFTNVILNFRLLKWYIISSQEENKKGND